uniref:CUB_2 domain-containing protein n=1 Tax=Caenorhabditis tropicalis TaxID=1561998 RepID=A0A1I7TLN2_9PELO
MNNTQAPLCGSLVTIIMKRNPKRTENEQLIKSLQSNHVFVRITGSSSLLGSSNPLIMYNLAVRTNGLYIFSDEMYEDFTDFDVQYLVYAPSDTNLIRVSNPSVTGKGTLQLSPLSLSNNMQNLIQLVYVEFNVQNHGLSDTFNKAILTIGDTSSQYSIQVQCDKNSMRNQTFEFHGGSLMKGMSYNMSLDFDYTSSEMESLEIRIWILEPINNYWPPYLN